MTMLELLKYMKIYLEVMLGQTAKTIIRPGQVYNGPFVCIQAVTDLTLVSMSDDQIQEGAWQANDTITAGQVIFGNIGSVEISDGIAIGYIRVF